MPPLLRLHSEEQGKVVRLELTGGNGYPRLSTSLLEELDSALSGLLADRTCTGIVIHGSDRCFAAGAEISEVAALTGLSALPFVRRGQLLFEKIAQAPKPVVAAVTGPCRGGAFDLALACWVRLAAPEATFGHPGPTLGLLTGWGGTQRLPQLIGRTRALELLLLGEPLSADRALALSLIDAVVPAERLLPEAAARAQARLYRPCR